MISVVLAIIVLKIGDFIVTWMGSFEAPNNDQSAAAKCAEKLGLVPNVVRAFTGNQEKLRNFNAYYGTLMLDRQNCGLSKLEREMMAVVVSSANRCYYCLVAHWRAVRELSGDLELGEMMALN